MTISIRETVAARSNVHRTATCTLHDRAADCRAPARIRSNRSSCDSRPNAAAGAPAHRHSALRSRHTVDQVPRAIQPVATDHLPTHRSCCRLADSQNTHLTPHPKFETLFRADAPGDAAHPNEITVSLSGVPAAHGPCRFDNWRKTQPHRDQVASTTRFEPMACHPDQLSPASSRWGWAQSCDPWLHRTIG